MTDAPTPQQLSEAWQHVHDGKCSPEEGRMVVAWLAEETGYYKVPEFESWMKAHGTASGYAEHCAQRMAQRLIFAKVLTFLNFSPERLALGRDRARL